jgi:hypothetical protein
VFDAVDNRLTLETDAGSFFVQVLDAHGLPTPGNVVAGQERPPRGWLSRYYGEKVAVPSFAVAVEQDVPATFVSVLSGGRTPDLSVDGAKWSIGIDDRRVSFLLADGRMSAVACTF